MVQAFLHVILLELCTNTSLSNIRAPLINQTVSKGSIVTLTCQADGLPKPEILWKLNGIEIKNSDRFKLDPYTGALTIKHVEMTDNGRYECSARNHEEDQASLNLIIQSNTTIIEGPEDQKVIVFSSVLMNCSVVADMTQKLTVMWKKNNVDLGLVSFSKSERINTDENYTLRIKNVTFDDSGVYTCIAETTTSHATAHGELTVEGIPPLLAQPNWPADQMEGSVITLTCTVLQGYPAPDIAWYKDGHSLTTGHSLLIPTAQVQHSGDYTCQAHNNQGSDSVLIPLRVRKKTRVISLPIQYEFEEGQDLIFNCEAEVDEDLQESLKINWFKGEERLNVSYTQYNQTGLTKPLLSLLPNSSLLISGAQYSDLGHYSCEVLTSLQPGVRSYQGEIFLPEQQLLPLVIILVVILAIILLLLGICLTCHRMGYYGVHHAKTPEEVSIITKVNRFPVESFSPTITKGELFKKLPTNF